MRKTDVVASAYSLLRELKTEIFIWATFAAFSLFVTIAIGSWLAFGMTVGWRVLLSLWLSDYDMVQNELEEVNYGKE